MDKRDSGVFFTTRLVCKDCDSSYSTSDLLLVLLKYLESFLAFVAAHLALYIFYQYYVFMSYLYHVKSPFQVLGNKISRDVLTLLTYRNSQNSNIVDFYFVTTGNPLLKKVYNYICSISFEEQFSYTQQ